jgi:hypothetical protein
MEAPAFGRTVFVNFMPDLKPGYNLIWVSPSGEIAVRGCGDNLSCSHAANCLPKKAFPGYPSLL